MREITHTALDIQLDSPNVGQLEKDYLNRCIDSTFISTYGPYVGEFEQQFATFVDSPAAVSIQSGTAAIHLALYKLGIGPGDEVIVPALTFIASVNPVLYLGATPVIVDVDPHTWNMDPDKVALAITGRTKAILPVHIYGNPCAMDPLCDLAREKGIPIVEDAAESLGGTYGGRATGTFGLMGCFSFNGNKVMTTGGGGMIVSHDRDLVADLGFLANQARDTAKGYFHPVVGFNYRMTNLEASMGLAQMEQLTEFLARKRRFLEIYREALNELDHVTFQKEYLGAVSSVWLTSVLIEHPDKDTATIQSELKQHGIPSRRLFMPLGEHPPYQAFATQPTPGADHIYRHGLNLPSSTCNSYEVTATCAERVRQVLRT